MEHKFLEFILKSITFRMDDAVRRMLLSNQKKNSQKVSLYNLTLVYMVYGVIFGIPAATAAVYFLYRKGVI